MIAYKIVPAKKIIIRILVLVSMIVLFSHSILANAHQDGDGIPDLEDNCREISNPNQQNSDNDQYGNSCDAD